MKILFIVPYAPSLVRVRPYNFLRSLARRGHRITLVTVWARAEEAEALQELQDAGVAIEGMQLPTWRSLANGLLALPTDQPLQTRYTWDGRLARRIDEIVRQASDRSPFDVVHVEHLRGVRYALRLAENGVRGRAGAVISPPVVWDSVDCISHLFRQSSAHSRSLFYRLITRLELSRTEKFERRMLEKFPRILVTSPQDKAALLSLAGAGQPTDRVTVIPNGVDLDYFQPAVAEQGQVRDVNSIVVSGKMSYHANITMVINLVETVMPLVWAKRPDVCLWIVGKDPSPEIQALARHPNVTVTGTVADIRPYLQKAALAAAPLVYATGIQNKILESMACATPVVSSPQAIAALQAQAGKHLAAAQNPQEFAETTLRLLANPAERAAIGSAGRDYVVANHHWDRMTERLEEVYYGVNN